MRMSVLLRSVSFLTCSTLAYRNRRYKKRLEDMYASRLNLAYRHGFSAWLVGRLLEQLGLLSVFAIDRSCSHGLVCCDGCCLYVTAMSSFSLDGVGFGSPL